MWHLQMHDAILFDCDGTLADTMPAHYRAWLGITQPHGIEFDEDRFYSLGGRPTRDIIAQLASEAGVALDQRGEDVRRQLHPAPAHAPGGADVVVERIRVGRRIHGSAHEIGIGIGHARMMHRVMRYRNRRGSPRRCAQPVIS